MENINLEEFRRNPKYYLFGYQHLDSASMQASFIKSVYEGYCFSTPESVMLFSCGEDHYVRSNNCFLNLVDLVLSVPSDYEGHSGMVDWLFAKSSGIPSPNPLLPFEGFALIVYLAEWCVVNISTNDEHFRQTFYQGKTVTPCERRSRNDFYTPFIQLQFTVALPQFKSGSVETQKIKQAFQELRRDQFIPPNLQLDMANLESFEIRFK